MRNLNAAQRMGHYSKNLGPLADEVVTECEFVSLDQKRRVKAVRTMWDTGSNATILSTPLVSELRPDLFGQGGMRGIGGESQSSTYLMHVMMPTGDVITYQEVYASELEECDAIIGMDIINLGHFHLDLCQGETTFSFSLPNE